MLTPVDIENKVFGKGFRGYDEREVDDFMRVVVNDFEKLYRENADLRKKNEELTEHISKYKTMEDTMQSALMVAQQTAEDIKQSAHQQAENIVAEAQIRANAAIDNANQSISAINNEYARICGEADSFRAQMSALLTAFSGIFQDMPAYRQTHAAYVGAPDAEVQPAAPDAKGPEEAPKEKAKTATPIEKKAAAKEKAPIVPPAAEVEEKKPEPVKRERRRPDAVSGLAPYTDETDEPEKKEEPHRLRRQEQAIPHEPKVNPVVEELLRQKNQKPAAEVEPEKSAVVLEEDAADGKTYLKFDAADGESFDVFKDDPLS